MLRRTPLLVRTGIALPRSYSSIGPSNSKIADLVDSQHQTSTKGKSQQDALITPTAAELPPQPAKHKQARPSKSLQSFASVDQDLLSAGMTSEQIDLAKTFIRLRAENVLLEREDHLKTPANQRIEPLAPVYRPRPVGNIFKKTIEDARRQQKLEKMRRLNGSVAPGPPVQLRELHTSPSYLQQRSKASHSDPATAKQRRVLPPIVYKTAESVLSNESQTFLAGDGGLAILAEKWDRLDETEEGNQMADEIATRGAVRRGMLIQARRQGINMLFVVLCSILANGRGRILCLSGTGEILPLSKDDVQYIFPSGLVPIDLVKKAITGPDLLTIMSPSAADNHEAEARFEARREIGKTIRAVELAVEKRTRALAKLPRFQADTIWEHFRHRDPTKWTSITTDQAMEYLIEGSAIVPNLADRFAVYSQLMDNPDYFLAEEADMRITQQYSVRPKRDVNAVEDVRQWLHAYNADKEKGSPMKYFVEESRSVIAQRQSHSREGSQGPIPCLSPTQSNRAIINILKARLVEQRSTQIPPFTILSPLILRAIGLYEKEPLDQGTLIRFLKEVGELAEWDSLGRLRIEEGQKRDAYQSQNLGSKDVASTSADRNSAKRHDWGQLPVYVIDSASAKELDDGISIERIPNEPDAVWAHIHIADPTHWIYPGHPLAIQAEEKGLTMYLPEGGESMLPHELTMGEMSLGTSMEHGKSRPQPALTFSAKVNRTTGTVLDYQVRQSFINNVKIITYDQADLMIFGLNKEAEELADIKALYEISQVLNQRRMNNGALEWAMQEAEVVVDMQSSGNFPSLRYELADPTKPSRSVRVISELALLAGNVAARFASERQLPIPFRGSDKPFIQSAFVPEGWTAEQVLEDLRRKRDPKTGLVSAVDIAKAGVFFQPASLSLEPIDHHAIGVLASEGGYSRVTSPLRRFSDLMTHWQIKHALDKGKTTPLIAKEDMARRATYANRMERRFRRIDRVTPAYWRATFVDRYLKGLLQDASNGMPVHVTSYEGSELRHVDLNNVQGQVLMTQGWSSGHRQSTADVFVPSIGSRVVATTTKQDIDLEIGQNVRLNVSGISVWPNVRIIGQIL